MKQEVKFVLEVTKGDDLFSFTMPYASANVGLGVAYEVLHEMVITVKNELDARHKKLQEMKEKEDVDSKKEDTVEVKVD